MVVVVKADKTVIILWSYFFIIKVMVFVLQRKEVVTGAVEPTDSDCEWESSDDDDEETDEKVNALAVSTSSQLYDPLLAY